MMLSLSDLRYAITTRLASQIAVRDDGNGGAWIELPVYFPDGDAVSMRVTPAPARGFLRVSDVGEAQARLMQLTTPARAAEIVRLAARSLDARSDGSDIFIDAPAASPGELTLAAMSVAEAASTAVHLHATALPRRRTPPVARKDLVAAATPHIQRRIGPVERGPLAGVSGHEWSPDLLVPSEHIVIYTISPLATVDRAASVAGQISDLSGVNGYRFGVVVDDRDEADADRIAEQKNLLRQVAGVFPLSSPENWSAERTRRPGSAA